MPPSWSGQRSLRYPHPTLVHYVDFQSRKTRLHSNRHLMFGSVHSKSHVSISAVRRAWYSLWGIGSCILQTILPDQVVSSIGNCISFACFVNVPKFAARIQLKRQGKCASEGIHFWEVWTKHWLAMMTPSFKRRVEWTRSWVPVAIVWLSW